MAKEVSFAYKVLKAILVVDLIAAAVGAYLLISSRTIPGTPKNFPVYLFVGSMLVFYLFAILSSTVFKRDQQIDIEKPFSTRFLTNILPALVAWIFTLPVQNCHVRPFGLVAFIVLYFVMRSKMRLMFESFGDFQSTVSKLGLKIKDGRNPLVSESGNTVCEGIYAGLRARVIMNVRIDGSPVSSYRKRLSQSSVSVHVEATNRSFIMEISRGGASALDDLAPITPIEPLPNRMTCLSNNPTAAEALLSENRDLMNRLLQNCIYLHVNVGEMPAYDKLLAGRGCIVLERKPSSLISSTVEDCVAEVMSLFAKDNQKRKNQYDYLKPLLDDLTSLSKNISSVE